MAGACRRHTRRASLAEAVLFHAHLCGASHDAKKDALQREIIATEEELKRLAREAAEANTALTKIGKAGKTLENVGNKMSSASEAAGAMVNPAKQNKKLRYVMKFTVCAELYETSDFFRQLAASGFSVYAGGFILTRREYSPAKRWSRRIYAAPRMRRRMRL